MAGGRERLAAWWNKRKQRALALDWGREWKPLLAIVAVFIAAWYLPVGNTRFDTAVNETLELTKWYAREQGLLFR